jgi:hypothetical protein
MSRALILLGLPVHAWFGFLLLEYHVSEIVLVLLIEPEEFSRESFLVTHAYLCAMACGLAEYLIGFSAFPGYKLATCGLLSAPGLVGAIAGEALRKAHTGYMASCGTQGTSAGLSGQLGRSFCWAILSVLCFSLLLATASLASGSPTRSSI